MADRMHVTFNALGTAVGIGATHFKDRMGRLVRTHIPVGYPSWKKVPTHCKDDVWKTLQVEFDVPDDMRSYLEKEMPVIIRKFKTKLRVEHLDKHTNYDDQVLDVPPGVRAEDWERFCKNEAEDAAKNRRKKNAESRSKLMYSHTCGRYSGSMIEYNLKKKDPKRKITRSHVWVASHTKKNGKYLPSAEPYVKQVTAAMDAQAATEDENTTDTDMYTASLDTDPVAKVFGKDTKGNVRGVGSTISRRRCLHVAPALKLLSDKEKEGNELKSEMNIVNSKLDTLMEHVLGTKGKNVQPSAELVNVLSAGQSSVGTSSVSPANVPATSSGSCELRNMNFEIVAIATIVTDDTKGIFHGYKLDLERETKVILIKIVMPNTPIYKSGKQDGANIFEDVMEGGYLVWPKSLITY